MKTNKTKTTTTWNEENIDDYPIYSGENGPKTVGEIDNPEWYALVVASLTGQLNDGPSDDEE